MIIVSRVIDITHIKNYLLELKEYEHNIKDNIYYGSIHITNNENEDNDDNDDMVSLSSSNETMYDYSTLDTFSN